ncbi:MAG: TrkA family potassium uptake protein [Desulfuromonas sp.]|nr:TrkA family potassium uptake protein [Desulfuromonas sp.]
MRIVFVGAGELTVETATLLINRRNEVIIIEEDKSRIETLSETLDCSFLHGDGSRPNILKEAGPEHADYLFCLTENDQYNIIAALVGRSLGYGNVVVQIHNIDYLNICRELGLEHTVTPSKTISRYLADSVAGIDVMELSSLIKFEARCIMVAITKENQGKISTFDLPKEARIIGLYRDNKFIIADQDTTLQENDEALILTHSKHLPELTERFAKHQEESIR